MSATPSPPDRLARIVAFLDGAEALKDTLRSGRTPAGRPESTAEHSWRLALMALLLGREVPGLDRLRLIELCLVHDLGEAISGDIPAPLQGAGDKTAAERADLVTLCAPLPGDLRDTLLALWDEYEAAETLEARLAKGLDKIETVLGHTSGAQVEGFDHAFNLGYGRSRTEGHPLLQALRVIADARTRACMARG